VTLRPFGVYSAVALIVFIFALLGMAGIIPFTALVVFGMLAALCLAWLF
jgi:hypothetical protein